MREEVFAETAMAAKDAEDVGQGHSKRDEQIRAIKDSTGTDLNAPENAMLKIMLQRGAGARRVAFVSEACSSMLGGFIGQNGKEAPDCNFDAAGDDAEGKTLGEFTGQNGRRFLKEVEAAKIGARKTKRKARAARRVARQRLEGCKRWAKEGDEQSCAADKKSADTMAKLRPKRFARNDKLKARSNIIAETYESCILAGTTKKQCRKQANDQRKELRKAKPAKEQDDEEEGVDSMIYRRAVALLAVEENECGTNAKAACTDANRKTLKKRFGSQQKDDAFGKTLDVLRKCAVPISDAAENYAACLEAMGKSEWEGKDTDAGKTCARVAKDTFSMINGERKDGSDSDMWTKKAEKVEMLAKAKFEGVSTKFRVSSEEIDTVFESAGAEECSETLVDKAKEAVVKAAISALSRAGEQRMLREAKEDDVISVVKAKDVIDGKCIILLRTRVKQGDAEAVANAMNSHSAEGEKRRLAGGRDGSWSSAPSSEELPYGSEPETTNYASTKPKKGSLDIVAIACIAGAAMVVVGTIIGFAMNRQRRRSSDHMGTAAAGVAIELSNDPFNGHGRTNSMNPVASVGTDIAGKNPMLFGK